MVVSRRLLVVSDIHSNEIALEAVLQDARRYGPYDIAETQKRMKKLGLPDVFITRLERGV